MTDAAEPLPPMSTIPSYRLYSPAGVTWATAFGGTIAGGIILALNYRRLGQRANALMALILGTLAFPAIFVLAYVLPEKIPPAAFLVPQILGIRYLAASLQGSSFDNHLARGGAKASNWKGVGTGVLVLCTLSAIFIIGLMCYAGGWQALRMGSLPSVDMGHEQQIYYERGATRDAAQSLGEALQKEGFFDGKNPVSVFISGQGADREISFILADGAWENPEIVREFANLGQRLAGPTGGKPFTLRLIDQNTTEKKRIRVE